MFLNYDHDGGSAWRGALTSFWFRWHDVCEPGKYLVCAYVEGFPWRMYNEAAIVNDFGDLVGV